MIERLEAFLADNGALLDAIDEWNETIEHHQLVSRSRQLDEELRAETPDTVKATLTVLLRRIKIKTDSVDIDSRASLIALLSQATTDPAITHPKPADDSDDLLTLTAPARLKRAGREMRMVVANSDDQSAPDPSLLRIIARAHDINEIPCAMKQGIFRGISGKIFRGTGNIRAYQGDDITAQAG